MNTQVPGERYHVVIVGAGVSGLSLAALLAKTGRSVLVLESINYPGGCASSYERNGAWFDVGATTFCGTDPGQPVSLLFDEIGSFDGLLPSDPTLSVQVAGKRLDLTTDRSAWNERTSSFFGSDLRPFWNDVFGVADAVYEATDKARYLPPVNAKEFLADLPAASYALLSRLPRLFSSVRAEMLRHGVDTPAFRRFVDAQLLITNQTDSADALMLNGALGLSYANGRVSSVRGGMIRFARFLEERARSYGADIAYLQRVTSISQVNGGWVVRTAKKSIVVADTVVTQLPVGNLETLTEDGVRQYFTAVREGIESRGVFQWGAVTLYARVQAGVANGCPVNLQVLLDEPLPTLGSDSLFCTFSHEDDDVRTKDGSRTLSVSTHVPAGWLTKDLSPADYAALKRQCAREMLDAIRRHVPFLADLQPDIVEVGTPKTFRKYTGRVNGLVGGIPLSKKIFPWRYPKPVTPFPGLYTMGDTFFPGQGIPGVVLGALGIHRRISQGDTP